MNGIDHFVIGNEDIEVNFVRVGNHLGWFGHYYKPDWQSDSFGDRVEIMKVRPDILDIKEACELLADNAANTLADRIGGSEEQAKERAHGFATFLRAELNKRNWT